MRADYYFIVAFANEDCLSLDDTIFMISADNDDYAIARAKEAFRLYGGSRRVEVFTAGRSVSTLDSERKTGTDSVQNGGDNGEA
jgi:predicted O-methyltransferase YrrM